MHDLFYCKLAGDDAERCLALAAALQNAPDFVLLEQVFAPEADIFCFIFLPVQKPFELSVQRPSPDIAIVEYTQEDPATYYTAKPCSNAKAAMWTSPSNDTPLKPAGHRACSASNKPRPAARRLPQIDRLSV